MRPANINDQFLVRTWEQFNEHKSGAPAHLRVGDGFWSDGALIIKEGAMPRRTVDEDTHTSALNWSVYGKIWQEASTLLPCALPAVQAWPCATRVAYGAALLEDQLGRRVWIGYGYLSLIRILAPQVIIQIAPREACRDRFEMSLLTDADGVMIGALMMTSGDPTTPPQNEGCDGPFPTGFMHVGTARVEAARAATAARIAAMRTAA